MGKRETPPPSQGNPSAARVMSGVRAAESQGDLWVPPSWPREGHPPLCPHPRAGGAWWDLYVSGECCR